MNKKQKIAILVNMILFVVIYGVFSIFDFHQIFQHSQSHDAWVDKLVFTCCSMIPSMFLLIKNFNSIGVKN